MRSLFAEKHLFAALLWLALMVSVHAGSQTSADYSSGAESNDGGGSHAASTDYSSDGAFGPGNFAASADYAQRGGYVGQLNNAPVVTNYPLSAVSNTVIKVSITALLNTVKDADGDSITFVSVAGSSAQNGEASRVGNFVVYRPANGFTGSDSFTWVAQDSEGDRAMGTILAQVGAPPAPPSQPTLNLVSVTFDNAPGATDATLRFSGLPQSTYLVQYTGSLTPPITWTTLGSAGVTNGVFQIVDPTARSAGQRYYHTVFQSP
jgi:Big-like domain-containing protein